MYSSWSTGSSWVRRWGPGEMGWRAAGPPAVVCQATERTRQKWLVNVYNDTPADGMKLPCGDPHLRGASHLGKPAEQRAWGLPGAELSRALPSSPKPPPSSQHWTSQDSWLEERLKVVHFGGGGPGGILGTITWMSPQKVKEDTRLWKMPQG